LFCQNGWPENEKLQKQLKPYAAVTLELNIVSGLLLRGNRIVIPSKLQSDMIEKLHAGHQACQSVEDELSTQWWPSISKASEEKVLTEKVLTVQSVASIVQPKQSLLFQAIYLTDHGKK